MHLLVRGLIAVVLSRAHQVHDLQPHASAVQVRQAVDTSQASQDVACVIGTHALTCRLQTSRPRRCWSLLMLHEKTTQAGELAAHALMLCHSVRLLLLVKSFAYPSFGLRNGTSLLVREPWREVCTLDVCYSRQPVKCHASTPCTLWQGTRSGRCNCEATSTKSQRRNAYLCLPEVSQRLQIECQQLLVQACGPRAGPRAAVWMPGRVWQHETTKVIWRGWGCTHVLSDSQSVRRSWPANTGR